MFHALRAAVREVREPTAEERAEFASATPETRAFLTVRLAEARTGQRISAAEIRVLAEQSRAYAEALAQVADQREREERGEGLPFTLEELAEAHDAPAFAPE